MAEKKKILHIVEAMGGGIFTYIVELANGLCDEFDVTIAFGIRNETPENYADYFSDKVRLICVKSFRRNLNPVKDIQAACEIRKIVQQVSPDIVHLHSSKAGAIGRMVLNSRRYKMFYTPHGYSFFMEDIPVFKRKIFKAVEKICGKRKCLTVACGKGEWEKSRLVTANSTYVSNGINVERINRIMEMAEKNTEEIADKNADHKITVYTVGRICYQKNPELFNAIAEMMPEINFLWIGEGDMRECLTSPNIRITGWVESDKTIELACQGDIFILPSRWEGLPISLLEAMYMGKPCIVSNVAGNNDMISHRETGYICNTKEEFAAAIREVMKGQENKQNQMTENARREVLKYYNSEGLCERYRELYLKNEAL